ncbi:MAG: CRISPR-associated protein Csm5 [Thiohalocapsa sp.]|nr:CRISPR-associated protein Csm5 [Thiohalocapsa sp.]
MKHRFMSTWTLAITPLSPLHIGTGEDYEPTQYVIDGTALYAFSPEVILRVLSLTAREGLLRILRGRPNVDLLKQVQAFFHQHAERLIPEAEHVIPVLSSISTEYVARVGKTAQQERDRDIINQLRIARTYGDAVRNRPILPGSSLKGAIRTALLDRANAGAKLPPDIKSLHPNQRNLALQQRRFKYKQFQQDPLRLVQLGDAADRRSAEQIGTVIRYAVNRKRHPVTKDGREVFAQAERLRQVVECIPALRPRAFQGLLTLQDLGKLTGPGLPDTALRWTFSEIAGACNAFYRPILERELAQLHSRGFLDAGWERSVRNILTAQEPALSAGKAFLLRVGFHSGAESMTLNGVRDIRINMGKDPATGKTRYENMAAPKTIWLAAHEIGDRRDMQPFGWVLVEAVPVGQAFADWPGNRTESAPAETEWLEAVSARRTALRERLEQQLARETAAAAAAEQEARKAAEREAELAKLSPEGRQLAALRELLARDRRMNVRQAGGELNNELVALLKTAGGSWPPADCAALADLAEEIYGYVGWPSGKKKRERKAQIQALRTKV